MRVVYLSSGLPTNASGLGLSIQEIFIALEILPVPALVSLIYTQKKTNPVLAGVVRILVIFQERPVFSHIIQKVSARAFN